MRTVAEENAARDLGKHLEHIGPSEAVTRFIRSYGKVRVQCVYALHLKLYFRWLKGKGIDLTPDMLIRDNLECVYKSDAVDVEMKRRHRSWLEEYLNVQLTNKSESYRRIVLAVVKTFYAKNDSPLFGKVNLAEQTTYAPPRGLAGEEVRAVLRALPLKIRVPLLCMWQSGVEVNRILSLTWRDVEGLDKGEYPLKLAFYGRKRHKRAYFTFLGRDSIEHLRLWRESWGELVGRRPGADDVIFVGKKRSGMDPFWLNRQMKSMAAKLESQGAIQNGNAESWHTHMLRHSFKTEGEHAGVPSGIVEYFMGHNSGISWVYDNRDQVHERDFVEGYVKLEPFVSLDRNEAVLRERFEEERRSWITEIASLKREVARLAGSTPQAPRAGGGPKEGRPAGL